MNVAELYLQTAHLGFETTLEDSDRFYFAANRALLQVCKVRPAIRHYVINHKPLVNLIRENTFSPIEKIDDITYEAEDAKAYYFEADGNGVLYLEKYNSDTGEWSIFGEIPLQSNQTFVSYKGFIKKQGEFVSGRIRLRFTGEYLYSIKNVALYQYLYSGKEADIPAYEAYTRYDVKKLVSDFMALCCPPIKEEEENTLLNQEYEQEGDSIILLPYDKRGVYKVLYEHRPTAIENTGATTEDTQELDLDEELCSLMPLLVAAYVWIEDEPEKSEYYMGLYRERVQEIVVSHKNTAPVLIKSTNGW